MRLRGGFLSGLLLGVGIMYLLDPGSGRRRRARLRDQAAHARRRAGDGLGGTARDLRNRSQGAIAEARARLGRDRPDDEVLEARVRSEIGRVVSNPSAISVVANSGGRVVLSGSVPSAEIDRVLATATSVRGVNEVVNELKVRSDSGEVPSR